MLFNFSHRHYQENMALNLYTCGIQTCQSNHAYGPALRSGYLIHFILKGKGTYSVNGTTYHLSENQGFLIEPNELIYYQADKDEPWEYIWIGFYGTKAKDYLNQTSLNSLSPIINLKSDSALIEYVHQIIEASKLNSNNNLMILAKLYEFFYHLCEEAPVPTNPSDYDHTNYIEDALLFIQLNFTEQISIQDVANYIRIDRSYLHRLFKRHIKKSPQEYLMELRIQKATELLKHTDHKVSDVARSVGYTDPLLFSKIFKKYMHQTPSQYQHIQKAVNKK